MVFNGGVHFLFLLELARVFIHDDVHAGLSIAEGGVLGDFAAAEVHRLTWEFLIDLEFQRLEESADVRRIAEGLIL